MSDEVYNITNIPSMVVIENQKTALADIVAGTGLNLRNKLKKQMSDLTEISDVYFDEMSKSSDGKRPPNFARNPRSPLQSSNGTSNSNDVDLDEQKRMVEYYENQKIEQERQREREHEEYRSEAAEEDYSHGSNQKEETLVEVAPGMSLPLRSIEETYKSIVIGKTVSAKCFGCQQKLYATEAVTMVICGDCWLCMPPERDSEQERAHQDLGPDAKDSVGLGVTDEDIVKWFSKNQNA